MLSLHVYGLIKDRTNSWGLFATLTSGTSAFWQSDAFQKSTLFVISLVVGVLTIIHMALQIFKIAKSIIKEKKK